MKALFMRYLPLILLAVAWELTARLELVSSTALPPLSDVVAAWIDMIKDGELITNGASSLYRAAAGDLDRCWHNSWNIHGLVEAGQCANRANRGNLLPASEIGADSSDRDLARLWRRLQDSVDIPRLHAAGDDRRIQWRARE
jgi:hypothetical protein